MQNFAITIPRESSTEVTLPIMASEVLDIGDAMEAIHEEAYMNGYNWEAFMAHYLQRHHPDLLPNLSTDSEAGTYVAFYDGANHEQKADRLAAILNELLNQPEQLYAFLRTEGAQIQWD